VWKPPFFFFLFTVTFVSSFHNSVPYFNRWSGEVLTYLLSIFFSFFPLSWGIFLIEIYFFVFWLPCIYYLYNISVNTNTHYQCICKDKSNSDYKLYFSSRYISAKIRAFLIKVFVLKKKNKRTKRTFQIFEWHFSYPLKNNQSIFSSKPIWKLTIAGSHYLSKVHLSLGQNQPSMARMDMTPTQKETNLR